MKLASTDKPAMWITVCAVVGAYFSVFQKLKYRTDTLAQVKEKAVFNCH